MLSAMTVRDSVREVAKQVEVETREQDQLVDMGLAVTGLPSYYIMTWGCQMNEEDSEQIALFLERSGYRAVSDPAQADVVLLNTCSVRAKPEEKVWSELGRLKDMKRERPDMVIGVCGCMAQVESLALKQRAPHIDMVVGTGNIAAIPEMLRGIQTIRRSGLHAYRDGDDESGSDTTLLQPSNPAHIPSPSSIGAADRRNIIPLMLKDDTRRVTLTALDLPERKGAVVSDVPSRVTQRAPKLKAHVPIMYGCDKFCTFCIVPLTRGRERSRPTAEILAEIEGLAQNGTREVTLLGQTVNSYGKNMPEGRVPFALLLEKINAIRGIRRIRFTSPYPRDFTDELIDAIGWLESVCEHVHLPLQVGDDDLLLHMHRGYTVARYREIVDKLRERVPGIAITTDIMLGYPGETDAQYWNTMRLVEELRFDSAFMFAYSPRPNTKAAAMDDQVPQSVKIERLTALIALQNRITCEINAAQVGQNLEVFVEGRSQRDRDRLTGYTRTLKMVNFTVPAGHPRSPESLVGKLVPVRAVSSHLTGFIGELAD
jgi:tRNA-2-methylthio-N6-dimethylallyladenosine synthase